MSETFPSSKLSRMSGRSRTSSRTARNTSRPTQYFRLSRLAFPATVADAVEAEVDGHEPSSTRPEAGPPLVLSSRPQFRDAS